MSLSKISFLLVVAPALFACAPSTTKTTPTPAVCDLGKYQQYVGRNIGDLNLPRNGAIRIISPGQPVTMDYNASRTNVYVDDKGWIGKIECG